MTLHQRRTEHRMLHKRQGVGLPIDDGEEDGPNGPPGPSGNPGGGNGGGGTQSSSTHVAPPPSSTVRPPPPSSTVRPPPVSSTTPVRPIQSSTTPRAVPSSTTTPTSTPTSESSVASASAASSASASLSSVVSQPSSTSGLPTFTPGLRQNTVVQNTGVTGVSIAPGIETTGVAGDSNTENASGSGSNTGGIIGGVVGGLAALAALGIIVAFLLRKWRARRQEEDDFGTDFRRSAFVQDSRPPSMAQTSHATSPSISSPGMAGQGAYTNSAPYYDDAPNVGGYGTTGASAATAAAVAATLQERPKYVYGQPDPPRQDDEASEHAHGIYSSEPMVQTSYNPEAYGSYAAYDNNAGYQDATREYQGQEGYAVTGDSYGQSYGYDQTQGGYDQQGYATQQYAQGYDASQYAQYDAQGYDAAQYAQYDAYANGGADLNAAGAATAVTTNNTAATGTAAGHKASKASVSNDDAYGGM